MMRMLAGWHSQGQLLLRAHHLHRLLCRRLPMEINDLPLTPLQMTAQPSPAHQSDTKHLQNHLRKLTI